MNWVLWRRFCWVGILECDEKQKGEHLDLYGGSLVEMQKYTKLQAVLFQGACFMKTGILLSFFPGALKPLF